MDLSTLNYKQVRDVAGHAAYATQVVKNPDNEAKQMSWAAVLLANNDDDATLKAIVLTLWNAFAGVA